MDMQPASVSITAMCTSLVRSLHSHKASSPLFEDNLADVFVSEERMRDVIGRLAPELNVSDFIGGHPGYASTVIRTRYNEDALFKAIADGVTQYVILGAGFDGFAWRYPDVLQKIKLFEIDQPSTQAFKQAQLEASGLGTSPNHFFIPADLSQATLAEALQTAPFDRAQPAFFSWLGVTPYLTMDANLATLSAISSLACPGSYLVFTYVDQCVIDSVEKDNGKLDEYQGIRSQVASIGEPWKSGFDPMTLSTVLKAQGLTLVEDLSGLDMLERYGNGGDELINPSPYTHVATAKV